ncbi:MAG: trypsin-like peptidase domain-containing protein [Deltaproteobacteria bacterium]|nr:trypsin-like peptidase domain-containing protein [Deltaproteobacteria bacterium]
MAALALGVCSCAGGRSAMSDPEGAAARASRTDRRHTVRAVLSQNVRVVVVVGGVPVRSASGVSVGHTMTPEGALTYVLTNAHVVTPREKEDPRFVVLVDLPTGDSQEFAARVVAQGSLPDAALAVLTVAGVALDAATLAADDEAGLGDDVVIVAAPYGRALSVSGGMISQVELGKDRRQVMLKTDAAIGYGASGGGLFSVETGKLLGIVEGYRTAKVSIPLEKETYSFDVPMPGETFAAPAAKIRRFLADKSLGHLVLSPSPEKRVSAVAP